MQGILGIQREADRQALERDVMNMRGGMLRQDPSLMQRIGSAVADYAVPDRYLPSSVMEPRLDMSKLEALRGTPVDMADVPNPVPMLMDTMPMAGITAFHGSPHKFSKFDMSKIGTGEGAQAYGHGLYFAENPKVAKEYLRPEQNYQRATGHLNNRQEFVKDMMDQGRTKDDVWKMTQEKYGEFIDPSELSSDFKSIWAEPANLYKVDIPDDQIAKMLDWDKVASDMPDEILDRVKDANVEFGLNLGNASGARFYKDLSDSFYKKEKAPLESKRDAIIGKYDDYGDLISARTKMSLEDRMAENALSKQITDLLGVGEVKASDYLRSKGIPGIKYLDGGSRSGGQGTSNFVLFDDQIPQILEINDKPVRGVLSGQ